MRTAVALKLIHEKCGPEDQLWFPDLYTVHLQFCPTYTLPYALGSDVILNAIFN